MVQVRVNGEMRTVEPHTTVSQLLEALDVASGPVAVEINRVIVPKATHATTELADADAVEIVTAVGGG